MAKGPPGRAGAVGKCLRASCALGMANGHGAAAASRGFARYYFCAPGPSNELLIDQLPLGLGADRRHANRDLNCDLSVVLQHQRCPTILQDHIERSR